ncbi:hypothetical protein [Hamadaea tsunoensis]|uniref:hypothetical protein n=1 Tax=Hamadaea tsunoensis TaxID=53368 RepID=UPI00040976EF|nr:hypothetical protein [Hamadaea tsunoensis]
MKLRSLLAAAALTAAALVVPSPAYADSGDFGLVWDAVPTLADQWFTAGGRSAHIVRSGTGSYTVTLLGRGNPGGNVQVMAVTTGDAYCQAGGWYQSGVDEVFTVYCYTGAGVATDIGWSADYVYRSGTGGQYAYLWANQPTNTATYTPSPQYAYDSTGGTPQISRWSAGHYWVYLPASVGLGWVTPESFQVTAYGWTPAHCQLSSPLHDDGWQEVACDDTHGSPVDAYFDVRFAYHRAFIGVTGVPYTYGYVTDDARTLYAYSSTGLTGTSALTTTHTATGRYTVRLAKVMTSDEPFANAYATNDIATYCSVDSWSTAETTEILDVSCRSAVTGAAADSPFFVNFTALHH